MNGSEPASEVKVRGTVLRGTVLRGTALRGTVLLETGQDVQERYAAAVATELDWRPVVGRSR
jgi:hypothetical protein